MDLSVILQTIIAAGVGGSGVALINYFLTRPKIRAEAASIATTATETVIIRLTAENARLSKRVDELEEDQERDQAERRRMDEWAWLLQTWAMRAYDELHRLGSLIEAPPQRERTNP